MPERKILIECTLNTGLLVPKIVAQEPEPVIVEISIMSMKTFTTFLLRLAQLVITFSIVAATSPAQSGRSWMNGFVFADSDTRGLAGATVELTGDQSNARLRSVRLSTKTEQDGEYSIKDIPYGEYTFRVSADGYDPYEIKLYIGSDMLTQIHVRLKKK